MTKEHWIFFTIIFLILATIAGDRLYLSNFKKEFKEIEARRIDTSNKLNTAKIVHEDLTHVRELVFNNMVFPGHTEPATHEAVIFDFITECVNDLKMELISLKAERPVKKGPLAVYGYEIRMQGDFFSFGELCAKFENSRRIVSIEEFQVALATKIVGVKRRKSYSDDGYKGIDITMFVNTFRVKKGTVL